MLTKKTSDHMKFLKHKKHTVYFNSVNQCAKYCKNSLINHTLREQIAKQANIKIKSMKLTNEDFIKKILKIYENKIL